MAHKSRPDKGNEAKAENHLGIANAIEHLTDSVSDAEALLGRVRGGATSEAECEKREGPCMSLGAFLAETESLVNGLTERLNVVVQGLKESLY